MTASPRSGSTIRRWECPECGRIFGSAPMSDEVIGDPRHSPKWSAEFERNPMPCDGTPIERVYVRTDALLSEESVRAADATIEAWVKLATGPTAIENTRSALRAAIESAIGGK